MFFCTTGSALTALSAGLDNAHCQLCGKSEFLGLIIFEIKTNAVRELEFSVLAARRDWRMIDPVHKSSQMTHLAAPRGCMAIFMVRHIAKWFERSAAPH